VLEIVPHLLDLIGIIKLIYAKSRLPRPAEISHFQTFKDFSGKRRQIFATFITKERLNFPAANHYLVDIITHVNL
jgi:hypothetical protein